VNRKIDKKRYSQLIGLIDEDIDEIRYLVVVDENYGDDDSDEFDDIDPEDYTHLVYITQRLQDLLGDDGMTELVKKLEANDIISAFYASDSDLYGVKSEMDEGGIADLVLDIVTEIVT